MAGAHPSDHARRQRPLAARRLRPSFRRRRPHQRFPLAVKAAEKAMTAAAPSARPATRRVIQLVEHRLRLTAPAAITLVDVVAGAAATSRCGLVPLKGPLLGHNR